MRHDEISNFNVASLQCSNIICTGCVLIDFTSNGVFPMQVTYPAALPQVTWSLDDLPRVVACSLTQGSNVTSMDFHPSHHTLLLGMTPFFWWYPGGWGTYSMLVRYFQSCPFIFQWDLQMVKSHCGRLVSEKSWCQSSSEYGKWLLVHRNSRSKEELTPVFL